MMKTKKHQQLHDSLIEEIRIDPLLSKVEVVLGNRANEKIDKWLVTCVNIVRIKASSLCPERDFIDVYDLVEIFDEECLAWKRQYAELTGIRPSELTIYKLLFASMVFAGADGKEGFEIMCQQYSVKRLS